MRRDSDKKRIRRGSTGDPQRCVKSTSLRGGQELCEPEDRTQQLMHPSERKLRLGLNACCDQRPGAQRVRPLARSIEQRRLSDACLAADHECPTPVVNTIDKGTDVSRLGVTPDQRGAKA
jgi:hypothetical protein